MAHKDKDIQIAPCNVKNTCKTKACKLLHASVYQMTHKSGYQMLESIKYKKTHTQVRAIHQSSQPNASISHL